MIGMTLELRGENSELVKIPSGRCFFYLKKSIRLSVYAHILPMFGSSNMGMENHSLVFLRQRIPALAAATHNIHTYLTTLVCMINSN